MGEIRALGTRFDEQPWTVGVEGVETEPLTILDVTDRAVATSSATHFNSTPPADLTICWIRAAAAEHAFTEALL